MAGVWYKIVVCVRSRRRVRGINRIIELCPCLRYLMRCLVGNWSHITPFTTFGVAGHGDVVVLVRLNEGLGWMGGTCGVNV